MGGEGSMLHAIKSLKQNRALLKKRKSASQNDLLYGSGHTQVEFKKVSAGELARIKADIREQARRSRLRQFLAFVAISAILIGLVMWLVS